MQKIICSPLFYIALIVFMCLGLKLVSDLLTYPALNTDVFPLEETWSTRVKGKIREISASDDGKMIFARTNYWLHALDAATGKEVWKFHLEYQVQPSSAVSENGMVYLADAEALWVIDQTTGQTIWSQRLPNEQGSVEDAVDNKVLISNATSSVNAYEPCQAILYGVFRSIIITINSTLKTIRFMFHTAQCI